MAKKSSSGSKTRGMKIPAAQYDLPATFGPDGNMVKLKEVMEPGFGSVMSLASLSPEKRAELTATRIAEQPKFELAMIGGGMIDRARAIQEVQAHSEIGRILIEIEQRLIQNLLDEVAAQ